MSKKKSLIFFLIFILLHSCSFDDKTGIWSGSKKEKEREKQEKMSRIAIHRPGAIGDVVMISNCFPKLREQYDQIDLFCHESVIDILGGFFKNHCLVEKIISIYQNPYHLL